MIRFDRTARTRVARWGVWTLSFLSFPVAGLAAMAVAGPVSGPAAAAVGGAAAGLVIGTGQAIAARGRLDWRRWIPASTVGMSAGLLLGSAAVGYQTTLPALAAMGAVSGVLFGLAQALALPAGSRRWAWAAALPALWALGWTLTTLIGVDVERQYANFGAIGAVTFSALAGVLLEWVLLRRSSAAQDAAPLTAAVPA